VSLLLAVPFLLTLIEGLTEYILDWVGVRRDTVEQIIKKQAAAVVAVVVCLLYGVDLLADALQAFGIVAQVPYAGMVLTGLALGRGSNFANNLFGVVLGLAGQSKATAALKLNAADKTGRDVPPTSPQSDPSPRPSRHATGVSTGATSASGDRGATPPTPDPLRRSEAEIARDIRATEAHMNRLRRELNGEKI
jgi:hypothetical protein